MLNLPQTYAQRTPDVRSTYPRRMLNVPQTYAQRTPDVCSTYPRRMLNLPQTYASTYPRRMLNVPQTYAQRTPSLAWGKLRDLPKTWRLESELSLKSSAMSCMFISASRWRWMIFIEWYGKPSNDDLASLVSWYYEAMSSDVCERWKNLSASHELAGELRSRRKSASTSPNIRLTAGSMAVNICLYSSTDDALYWLLQNEKLKWSVSDSFGYLPQCLDWYTLHTATLMPTCPVLPGL